jgi:hypothetical protein
VTNRTTIGWTVLACVAVTTGCRAGANRPTASPTATTPSATASTLPSRAPSGPLAAVVTKTGALSVYEIDSGRHSARLLRSLAPPAAGAKAISVSLAGSTASRVCAVWEQQSTRTLTCYDAATGAAQPIPTGSGPGPMQVALTADGSHIAWGAGFDPAVQVNADIQTAELGPSGIGAITTVPAEAGHPPPTTDANGAFIEALAWRGNDALLVSVSFPSDFRSAAVVAPLATATAQGWTKGARVVPSQEDRNHSLAVFDKIVSPSSGTTAFAVERSSDNDPVDRTRAVAVDIDSGRVVTVIAEPAAGRAVVALSGGATGIVYQTDGNDGLKVYWKAPTETHGQPLSGLPADVRTVLAQP